MPRPTDPTYPPVSGTVPVDPRSIPALAAALLTCRHPDAARVSGEVLLAGEHVRLSWCASCGALGATQIDGSLEWQTSACGAPDMKAPLEDLAQLLHRIREMPALIEAALQGGPSEAEALRATGSDLARSLTVLDVDRIDAALGRAVGAPSTTPR